MLKPPNRALIFALAIIAPSLLFGAEFTPLNYNPISWGSAYRVSSATAVPTTAEAYSAPLSLIASSTFGVSGSCTGTGTQDVKLEWQSANVADTDNFVTTSTILASASEAITPQAFSPVPSLYGRIKLTGQGSNNAATVCTLDVFLQGNP